jgi:predicted ATPase with chaperone activity
MDYNAILLLYCPGCCDHREPNAGVLTITWLLIGPSGAGKLRLAHRLTTILPAMTLPEAIETTRIHRVAGRTGDRTALVTTRPCRPPLTPSRTSA